MFWTRFWSLLCLLGNRAGTSDLSSSSFPPFLTLPPSTSACSSPSQLQALAARGEPGSSGRSGETMMGGVDNGETATRTHKQTECSDRGRRTISGWRRDGPWSIPVGWPQHKHVRLSSIPQPAGRHLHKAAPVLAWLILTWGSMWDGRSLLLPCCCSFPPLCVSLYLDEMPRPTPDRSPSSLISQSAEERG